MNKKDSNDSDAISLLRRLHKPTEVRLHHIPRWFRMKLIFWLKLHDHFGPMITFDPIREFARIAGWHIDHYGSSSNGRAFVNEPYGDRENENKRIAELLHCDFVKSENSYWYPGQTSRYEFRCRIVTQQGFDPNGCGKRATQ